MPSIPDFLSNPVISGVFDKFSKFPDISPPDAGSLDYDQNYARYAQSYLEFSKLGHAVVMVLSGHYNSLDSVSQTAATETSTSDEISMARSDGFGAGEVFETGSEVEGEKDGVVAAALVSKRKRTGAARGRAWKNSVAGTKVLATILPPGLCYAVLFRGVARESVALQLSFWPSFSDLLSQPAEAAMSVFMLSKMRLSFVEEGRYHVSCRKTEGSVSLVYSLRALARGCTFPFGTFGYALGNFRTYVDHEVGLVPKLTDLVGGEKVPLLGSPSSGGCLLDVGITGCVVSPQLLNCSEVRRSQSRVCRDGFAYVYDFRVSFDSPRDLTSYTGGFLRPGDSVAVSCAERGVSYSSVVNFFGSFRFYESQPWFSSPLTGPFSSQACLQYRPFCDERPGDPGFDGVVVVRLHGQLSRFENFEWRI